MNKINKQIELAKSYYSNGLINKEELAIILSFLNYSL